ncbi:LexA family transcriptional regulator [Bacillus shivajii]|uniref:helix-turn-helix domain-containing protein n=1 Tax=Bacillus shivajii TaxID=1983719 RepID=UPI001CFAD663|nr:LexA family transcriptional regulator [Bacillus shivajii]UCZ53715.1 LexA family transcriptional regulator [Bacillus shivajii]
MDRKQFGKLIAKLRKESGYDSQRKFATVTGVSNASIAKIENGTQKARPDTLKAFSKHLTDITYADLMEMSGYLEGSIKQEKHDKYSKYEFISMIEELTIDLIKKMSKDDKFLPFVEAKLKELEEVGGNRDVVKNASSFIKFFENQNLNIQINLYSNIQQIYTLPEVKNEIDYYNTQDSSTEIVTDEEVNERIYKIVMHYNNTISENESNYEIVKPELIGNHHAFALSVLDNSMQGIGLFNGDVVICKKEDELRSYIYDTKICSIILPNGDEVIRKIQFINEEILLIPFHPDFNTEIFYKDDISITGEVVQIIRTLNQ